MRLRLTSISACLALAMSGSALACDGTVTIGEGASQIVTKVANNAIGDACINDLIIDTGAEGANYGNHGEFVATVRKHARKWVAAHVLSRRDGLKIIDAATRSHVGKTVKVRIIAFNDFHGNIDGANLNYRSDADGIFVLNSAGQRVGVPSASRSAPSQASTANTTTI